MTAPKQIQWWTNGDHPKDNSVELPLEERDAGMVSFLTEGEVVGFSDMSDHSLCPVCSAPWRNHGWIDDTSTHVHPGDWVSVAKVKGHYVVTHPDPMAQALATLEAAEALKTDES